jgi:hypothetical protein
MEGHEGDELESFLRDLLFFSEAGGLINIIEKR